MIRILPAELLGKVLIMTMVVESTSLAPDDVMAESMITFVITNGKEVLGGDGGVPHVDMLSGLIQFEKYEYSEDIAKWRDNHTSNSGYLVGTIVYLWGKPSEWEVELIVEAYGPSKILYWNGRTNRFRN